MHNFWCDSSEEQEWRCQKYLCSAQAHDKLQALSQLFVTAIKPLLPVPPNVLKCLQKQPCLQIWFQLRPTQQPTAALPCWLAFLAVPRALLFLYVLCSCFVTQVVQPFVTHTFPYLFKGLIELFGHPYVNFSGVSMLSTWCPCIQGFILFMSKALQTLM